MAAANLIDFSAAFAGVGALVLTAGLYVEFQRRRDKLIAIREAFESVVENLASEEDTKRLAAAILLRRFFDENSELGTRSLLRRRRRAPYAPEAVSVMAAVLRGVPTGNLQKLLADGLGYAHDLRRADLQRANLQNAYLAPHRESAGLEGADFFRADLSGASLKGSLASRAVFYQARLNGTVFTNADLRKANFFQADLTDARFSGAMLAGATFKEAVHIPQEVAQFLDTEGVFTRDEPVPALVVPAPGSRRVFFSLPSVRSPEQQDIVDRLAGILRDNNLKPEFLEPVDYPSSGQLSEIRRVLASCSGAAIFGFAGPRDSIGSSVPTPISGVSTHSRTTGPPTPWNHLEAGIAFAYNISLLIFGEHQDYKGIFDHNISERSIYRMPYKGFSAGLSTVRQWLALVQEYNQQV